MSEIPVSALEPRLQKLVESAQSAYARADDASVGRICREVLGTAPGCLPVRKLQRAARLRAEAPRGGLLRGATALVGAPALLLARQRLAQDPAAALSAAQAQLDRDPRQGAALSLLGDAARQLGWRETAVFAYEAWHQLEPDSTGPLVQLGRAQLEAGRPAAAVQAAEAALRVDPVNAAAQALQRDASVALSLRQGNWEDRGDFRGKLKR